VDEPFGRAAFDRLIGDLRPKLHRYCSRMTGSVIDGEDVLQDALLKATSALPRAGTVDRPDRWLFRIAHNAALDFLRHRSRHDATTQADEEVDMIVDPVDALHQRLVVSSSLRTFMRLPASQRGCVILRDVLGYSVAETCEIMESTVPATKSAIQRGRARLRDLAAMTGDVEPPALSESDRARLVDYVDRFNAHDFDAIRAMLADDVRLDLVNRVQMSGRAQVGEYFHRYAQSDHWRFAAGFVDRRPAILVFDPNDDDGRPLYFVLVDFAENAITNIRDFLFAAYAIDDADLFVIR
jgi:RNA polymerase sigma-70 factor, ECF subfamily